MDTVQIFTLGELVKKYGTKEQKQAFKKNGNLNRRTVDSILKEAKRDWEEIFEEGRGKERDFICKGKRSKKIEKETNYDNCGAGQLTGEYELNSLVTSFLIKKDNTVPPMSLNKWCIELGIIDKKLTAALYGARKGHLENLITQFSEVENYKKDDADYAMLDEFLTYTSNHIKKSLASVLKKLADAKIIIHQKERWGCTLENRHRKLTTREIKDIATNKRAVLTMYGLSARDLWNSKKKEVKEFKVTFEAFLKEMGLKYDYEAHLCVLQDSDKGVSNYLERMMEKGDLDFTYKLDEMGAFLMVDMFKNAYSERSLELAKGREKNTSNKSDTDRIKYLKKMNQYTPMWELLLKYFRCASSMKSNLSAVEKEAPRRIEIDGMELEVSNERKVLNPLATFQGIRLITEIYSN